MQAGTIRKIPIECMGSPGGKDVRLCTRSDKLATAASQFGSVFSLVLVISAQQYTWISLGPKTLTFNAAFSHPNVNLYSE